MMTISEIMDIVNNSDYECFGIRAEENDKYQVGDITENSHEWWQDDPEDGSEYNEEMQLWDGGELDGTCAVGFHDYVEGSLEKALGKAEKDYFGDHLYLIGSDVAIGGNDSDELIMSDAKVLAVIK